MKIKKILSFIIVLIIILNFSLITFANVIDVEYSKIEKLGESFGYYDGFLRGFIHYTENSQASYYEERPLIEEVIEKHIDYLENRGNTYQNHFLSGYLNPLKYPLGRMDI